ncbi:DUF3850 domain-containing protein [Lysinibacillus fusiformis]|uniref:DUF3850 domain-containing protein n=1 Tax=Lysinibacillus fusiformis TaxID=28031 RepID=UPI00119FEB13|nr:DUF3850 domain-containing protein [Lysinibacillus fusiformis]
MTVHELKTLPEYFGPVADGIKTFEIRKNDRGYQVGDLLLLKEYDDAFTGNAVLKEVTYLTADYQQIDYVTLAIKEPDFDVLDSTFGYNKAACLHMGYEPIWVLEEATDEDLEESISAVDAADVL